MKKILLASTAMVAFAGAAAAEVSLGGSAEVGVHSWRGSQDVFFTDVDVDFDMTGEADNGLTFGASVDLDETNDNDPFDEVSGGGVSYFLAYGGARLDAGDVDGALDAALTEVNVVGGSINDDETEHTGFSGNSELDDDGQVFTFSYSFDAFTGYMSIAQNNEGIDAGTAVNNGNETYGIGASYATEFAGTALGFGIGYQSREDYAEMWGVSADAEMVNGFAAAVNYTEIDYEGEETASHWAVGLGYTINAFAIGVNYGEFTDKGGVAGNDIDGLGVAMTYDLGGGLVAQAGYGMNDEDSTTPNDTYSVGLAMSF